MAFVNSSDVYRCMENVDSKDNEIECLISMETPEKDDIYFSWISVPTSMFNVYQFYKTETLIKWINKDNISDPNKCFRSLNFIKERAILYNRLMQIPRSLLISDVTNEFRKNILRLWLIDGKCNEQQGACVTLETFIECQLVHTFQKNNQIAEIFEDKPNGSWLFRKSSKHVTSGNSQINIISLSYKLNNEIRHSRFLYINSVGVYNTTDGDMKDAINVKTIEQSNLIELLNHISTNEQNYPNFNNLINVLMVFVETKCIKSQYFIKIQESN
jgi:hypothetical protein